MWKKETAVLNATCVPLDTDETVHLLVLVLICEAVLKPIVLLSVFIGVYLRFMMPHVVGVRRGELSEHYMERPLISLPSLICLKSDRQQILYPYSGAVLWTGNERLHQ